ncbi:MAG: hypothetical protein QUV07_15360 [Cyanobium sp. CZS 25K]|nr:hypothetical protein [Cyanobium sp. CZS25K]
MNPELAQLEQLLEMATEEDRTNLQSLIGADFGNSPRLLSDHFNFLHGGIAGQIWNRKSWKKLVTDVADHIQIDWNALLRQKNWDVIGAAEIEDAVIMTTLGRLLKSMPDEEREKLAAELATAAEEPNIGPQLVAGGVMLLGHLSGFQIYLLATTALGALTASMGIVLPFVIYSTMTTTIGIILGPIGWAALAASTLFSLSQANYSKLLPGVIYVSFIRHKLDQSSSPT